MRRILKIIAIIVVLLMAGTYTVYALEYKGNYNVSASITVNISPAGNFVEVESLSDFTYDSEPTSPVQFWDLFRGTEGGGGHGHKALTGDYLVTWTFKKEGTGDRTFFSVDNVPRGQSQVFKMFMDNEPPGHGTLTITVKNDLTGYIVHTSLPYNVVVG